MAKCTMCGNDFGLLESINREFADENKDRGVCLQCHKYFLMNIKSRLEEAEQFEQVIAIETEVLSDVEEEYGESACEYVKDFFRNYKATYRPEGQHIEAIKECPVCAHDNLIYEKECLECGYIFEELNTRTYRETAQILNNRYNQYLSNPMYEYKVEVLQDTYGLLNGNYLQRVLDGYAMNGWRLKSVFTNETGQDMREIGNGISRGTAITHEQTFLVFERCIRGQEECLPVI